MNNQQGSKNARAKLSEAQVLEMLKDIDTTEAGVLARKYGVSKSAIKGIRIGSTWGHLTGRVHCPKPRKYL